MYPQDLTNYLNPSDRTRSLAQSLIGNAQNPYDVMNIFKNITVIKAEDGNPIVKYLTDLQNYRQLEFWASPDTTINRRAGDCDDIALLIGSMLNGLPSNLKPDNVRLTVGVWEPNQIAAIGQAMFPMFPFPFVEYHAWTEADIGNQTWICDGVGKFAGPASNPSYRPYFSLYPDKIVMMRRPR